MTRRFAVTTAVILVTLLAVAAPSWAHHKSGHSQGGGKATTVGNKGGNSGSGGSGGSGGTTYTEDNDTNDNGTPNNLPDAGDNAHPSGKDKSVEPGNSGNQGSSSSDPDDDGRGPDRSNGGADKPNGPGGVDLADQDGNNGCGNDDDFEDDNEGWCGKNPKRDEVRAGSDEVVKNSAVETDKDAVETDKDAREDVFESIKVVFDLDEESAPQVLGTQIERESARVASADTADDVTAPLAREATQPEAADEETGALPFTGGSVTTFVLIGVALIAAGLVIRKLRVTQ